jgi:outer membrane protein assembly factor BamB
VGVSLAFSGLTLMTSAAAGASDSPPDAPAGSATTFQLNPRHDGHSPTQLKAPLQRAWSHDFGAQVGYPLIVNGRVFVTTSPLTDDGPIGASLWAVDASNGTVDWGPASLGSADGFAGITADGANVYAVNSGGTVRAFDQATGTEIWSRQLLSSSVGYNSPPTVRDGTLYVVGLGKLYALDAASGAVRWSASVSNGDHSSPAVTADQVIVQFACRLTQAFDVTDGSPRWSHVEGCQGGGGRTPVLHDDQVYVRDEQAAGRSLEIATGAGGWTFSSMTAPTFADNTTFLAQPSGDSGFTLTAVELTSHHPMWSQVGDGHLVTAPLAIGDSVAVGSSTGRISLFDTSSGIETWSADVGSPIRFPDEHNGVTLVGLSTSGDLLLVPATNTLVAYRSAPSRAASRTRLEPTASTQLGEEFGLHATVSQTDGGGTVSFFADGATTPMPGCEALRLSPVATGWESTCRKVNPSFGDHTFTARYTGDAAYAPSSVTISHAVISAKTHIKVDAKQLRFHPEDPTVRLYAWLMLSAGPNPAGRTLTFSRDGVVLCKLRTDAKGRAICFVPRGGPVDVTFAGSAQYRPSSTRFTIPASY